MLSREKLLRVLGLYKKPNFFFWKDTTLDAQHAIDLLLEQQEIWD